MYGVPEIKKINRKAEVEQQRTARVARAAEPLAGLAPGSTFSAQGHGAPTESVAEYAARRKAARA